MPKHQCRFLNLQLYKMCLHVVNKVCDWTNLKSLMCHTCINVQTLGHVMDRLGVLLSPLSIV